MSNAAEAVFSQWEDHDLPKRHATEYKKFGQDDRFFHLALQKSLRRQALRERYAAGREQIQKILLGSNFAGFNFSLDGKTVQYLPRGFFHDTDEAAREQKRQYLKNAIVIVNNNDVGPNTAPYGDFHQRCDSTIFAVWDFDNHHWLDLSTYLAAHSDVYSPAHHENLYLLSRYNDGIAGPVYCATIQWPRHFITENLPTILTIPRKRDPLGMHVGYFDTFTYRARVGLTLNQHYSSVGFSSPAFHHRSPLDRLTEWASHKLHWIIPVLNDVPIRLFDALATGGIPIIPESMRGLAPIKSLPREHVLFYSPTDVMSPQALVEKGNEMFDKGGIDKVAERHRLAIEHHHADSRIKQILEYVAESYGPGAAVL